MSPAWPKSSRPSTAATACGPAPGPREATTERISHDRTSTDAAAVAAIPTRPNAVGSWKLTLRTVMGTTNQFPQRAASPRPQRLWQLVHDVQRGARLDERHSAHLDGRGPGEEKLDSVLHCGDAAQS